MKLCPPLCILSSLLAALVILPSAPAEIVDLRINDVSGLDEPWPLLGGVPFPEGRLTDPSRIRVLSDGEEVAAQVDVTATWKDGSIRWALIGMNANPNALYQVEFGEDISVSPVETTLTVESDESGRATIDTGAVRYEFHPDELLPRSAEANGVVYFKASGDGAYLIDNHGRLARAAGPGAEVSHELLREGPQRVVVRREGWYVTPDGMRIARAKAWFYFTAGSPFVRITHTLVLTEDTNELWVRDYGLEFLTPEPADEVTFAMGMPGEQFYAEEPALLGENPPIYSPAPGNWPEEYGAVSSHSNSPHLNLPCGEFIMNRDRTWEERLVTLQPGDDEVYLFQETYPHFFDPESRAVIGRVAAQRPTGVLARADLEESFWLDKWEVSDVVAGDWADGDYGNHGLTVVMPWLAARFPKEIAFNPKGFRVAFWSSRGGRELDLRMGTIVRESWKDFAELVEKVESKLGPDSALVRDKSLGLAQVETNAQGAARTHDVWLLPRTTDETLAETQLRAMAVVHPPLLHSDPAWASSTQAIGWPMHPRDEERFAGQEAALDEYWQAVLRRNRGSAWPIASGFVYFGRHPTLRIQHNAFFRFGRLADYELSERVWPLFARSGDRSFHEYGTRFNQFASDMTMAHWDGGGKYKGGWASWDNFKRSMLSYHWGDQSSFHSGKDPRIFLWEYYHTGHEPSREVFELYRDAVREHYDPDDIPLNEATYRFLERAAVLHAYEWDDDFLEMAKPYLEAGVDLENPTGFTDKTSYGPLYKSDRAMVALYEYYKMTGDPLALKGFLQRLDYKYRFNRFGLPFSAQDYAGYLFSIGYELTGNPNYLRVINYLLESGEARHQLNNNFHTRLTAINIGWHIMKSMPTLLEVITEVDSAIEPYPVAVSYSEPGPSTIIFEKGDSGASIQLRLALQMKNEKLEPTVEIRSFQTDGQGDALGNFEWTYETAYLPSRGPFRPRRVVDIAIPADWAPGYYALEFPETAWSLLFESDAPRAAVYAPEGFRLRSDGVAYYFSVPEGVETLDLVFNRAADSNTRFSGLTTIRRPDGSVALDSPRPGGDPVPVPVEGHYGTWSVISTQDGTYLQLLNVPPVFARTPEWLPDDRAFDVQD